MQKQRRCERMGSRAAGVESKGMQNLIDKETARPPAIFRRPPSRQYMAYIGYHHAKIGPAIGKRVRKVHYLGRDLREATLNAILIDRRWDRTVADWKTWRDDQLSRGNGIAKDWRLPFWPTDNDKRLMFGTLEGLRTEGLVAEVIPFDEQCEGEVAYLPIYVLKEQFLEAMNLRIGMLGKRGLKSGTYKQMAMSLKTALRGLDANRNVLDLTREDIRQFVDYWASPKRELSERTVANYCKVFKRMIDWADNESVGGFSKPKIDDLFKFANPRGNIERFDPDRLKKLLAVATDRCRLYVMLALNTGYNQVDISDIRRNQIIEINGDTFLVRRRQKSSHQNDFRTQHYLWPETLALLSRHFAHENAEGYALLNVNGKPLLVGGTDNIRDTMHHVRNVSGIMEITYKQLRKFGIGAIRRVTLNSDTARMYASQKIAGVMSHYDRDDFFEPLTHALKKWRDELIALGIMALANPTTSTSDRPDNSESDGDGQDHHPKAA